MARTPIPAPAPAELIARLRRPLTLEANQGYPNTAVVGRTIAVYAREWAERVGALHLPLADAAATAAACLRAYDGASPEERAALVTQALAALDGLNVPPAETPAPRPARRAPARRADAQRGRAPAPLSLDAPHPVFRAPRKPWTEALTQLGLHAARDFLVYFPRDYLEVKRIADLQDNDRAAAVGVAGERRREPRHGGLTLVVLEVSDGSGTIHLHSFARGTRQRGWSPLALMFKEGTRLLVEGTVKRWGQLIEMQYQGAQRLRANEGPAPGTLLPLYPLTEGLYQNQLRPLIRQVVAACAGQVPDPLSDALRTELDLLPLAEALRQMHAPASAATRDAARRRLAFDELFVLQVALARRRAEQESGERGLRLASDQDIHKLLAGLLPFPLTDSQTRVVNEVAADLAAPRSTMRLIQGDVGSGKTIVALAAILIAVRAGYQAALMAPTELLAAQHHVILSHFLQRAGTRPRLLIGALPADERERTRAALAAGEESVVIGTHALIQEGTQFQRLGLVIVDEQHRFGVLQRAALRRKGENPEVLVMTATPIPRSLAMTLYGDLDLSTIDTLPPGRRPVATFWGPMEKQDRAWAFVREHLQRGRQAYVVCPLIEESERLEVEAAAQVFQTLRSEVFPDRRVGLVHGRMSPAERDETMTAFRRGAIQVLCSTSVIEVGIDVPNASVIVILNAERFGLSQLHQLRGRVGRSTHKSACLVLSEEKYDPQQAPPLGGDDPARLGRERMRIITTEQDGFRIAEADLALRGPGDFLGARQHGLPEFRVARLSDDLDLLRLARETAFRLVADDPQLTRPEHRPLAQAVRALRSRLDPPASRPRPQGRKPAA